MIPLTLISAAVAAVVGFGLAWQLQAGNITQLKLDQTDERSSIQRTARQPLERHMQTVATAEASSSVRVNRNRADAGRAGDSGSGLRIASADTVRNAPSDPSACNAIISAYSAVVDSSSRFIQEVAIDADQCHSDLTLMQEAWPK